jgi:pimeloyl-[acyl-carrier protein] methyl ester esterase
MPGSPLIETRGAGPDVVLVHGWGMHRGVWGHTAEHLAQQYRLHLVDLPGHGTARDARLDDDLPGLAAAIVDQVPRATWLGWSMGGLVTLQALLDHGAQIERAILVACNPSFVVRPHWPDGVAETLFTDFAQELQRDFEGTLNRFLVLETLGSETARESLRALREDLHSGPMPDRHALRAGLSILRRTDYSGRLAEISRPTLWLAGGRDRLVPPAAMKRAAERVLDADFVRIPGAGHAPFIGHRDAFGQAVIEFLEREPCQ